MVCVCAEKGCEVCQEKDAEDEAAREEEMEDKEMVYRCVEGGRAGGWCDRGRCRGQGEMEGDPLWLPRTGEAERRRRRRRR